MSLLLKCSSSIMTGDANETDCLRYTVMTYPTYRSTNITCSSLDLAILISHTPTANALIYSKVLKKCENENDDT